MVNIKTIFSQKNLVWLFAAIVFAIYFFSNPSPQYFYDYTFRVAGAMFQGHLGLNQPQPSWLNEMIKFKGEYFSAFPLGSVISVLPFAVLKSLGIVVNFPARFLASLLAAAGFIYAFLLTNIRKMGFGKRIFLGLVPVLASWTWTNLTFGGAWQIALGFALVGELAALYYLLVKKNYILAGVFFAVALGNRTEIAALAPLFAYLIFISERQNPKNFSPYLKFFAVPLLLLILTVIYNFVRFGSVLDFGYARIPGVLKESWYSHGIFSFYAIPLNFYTMLLRGWNSINQAPFFIPSGYGGSILLSAPWIFLLFREHATEGRKLVIVSWLAAAILSLILWVHGDPGGWQFSYRYAMVLIPWLYLILILTGPETLTSNELVLFMLSFIINGYATWLYYWTKLLK